MEKRASFKTEGGKKGRAEATSQSYLPLVIYIYELFDIIDFVLNWSNVKLFNV